MSGQLLTADERKALERSGIGADNRALLAPSGKYAQRMHGKPLEQVDARISAGWRVVSKGLDVTRAYLDWRGDSYAPVSPLDAAVPFSERMVLRSVEILDVDAGRNSWLPYDSVLRDGAKYLLDIGGKARFADNKSDCTWELCKALGIEYKPENAQQDMFAPPAEPSSSLPQARQPEKAPAALSAGLPDDLYNPPEFEIEAMRKELYERGARMAESWDKAVHNMGRAPR